MFDVKENVNGIVSFIQDYFKRNNLKGVVLGISGGKDSAVASGLFSRAIGSENVIGVTLPCHSLNQDKTDAHVVAEHFGFPLKNLDLTGVFNTFESEFKKNFDIDTLTDANINLKPRLRMSSVYYIAQAMSSFTGKRYVVAGTSNACEIYVGYFTKGGDNVHDISVLGDLTVEEVIKVGEYIGVPHKILYKTPSDGLSNKSDEEKLGVKYDDIAKVIKGEKVDVDTFQKIESLHERNSHKFNIPTYRKDE